MRAGPRRSRARAGRRPVNRSDARSSHDQMSSRTRPPQPRSSDGVVERSASSRSRRPPPGWRIAAVERSGVPARPALPADLRPRRSLARSGPTGPTPRSVLRPTHPDAGADVPGLHGEDRRQPRHDRPPLRDDRLGASPSGTAAYVSDARSRGRPISAGSVRSAGRSADPERHVRRAVRCPGPATRGPSRRSPDESTRRVGGGPAGQAAPAVSGREVDQELRRPEMGGRWVQKPASVASDQQAPEEGSTSRSVRSKASCRTSPMAGPEPRRSIGIDRVLRAGDRVDDRRHDDRAGTPDLAEEALGRLPDQSKPRIRWASTVV